MGSFTLRCLDSCGKQILSGSLLWALQTMNMIQRWVQFSRDFVRLAQQPTFNVLYTKSSLDGSVLTSRVQQQATKLFPRRSGLHGSTANRQPNWAAAADTHYIHAADRHSVRAHREAHTKDRLCLRATKPNAWLVMPSSTQAHHLSPFCRSIQLSARSAGYSSARQPTTQRPLQAQHDVPSSLSTNTRIRYCLPRRRSLCRVASILMKPS